MSSGGRLEPRFRISKDVGGATQSRVVGLRLSKKRRYGFAEAERGEGGGCESGYFRRSVSLGSSRVDFTTLEARESAAGEPALQGA